MLFPMELSSKQFPKANDQIRFAIPTRYQSIVEKRKPQNTSSINKTAIEIKQKAEPTE